MDTAGNPKAHELTQEGFPWFGDEMELLMNGSNRWIGDESAAGSGASRQMVCNLTKSRLGGVGRSGLLEGEPRSQESAWNTSARWILEGTQNAVARPKLRRGGYVIAWVVRFDPCVEMEPGRYHSPGNGTVLVELNIAVGDPDRPTDGMGNYGGFHPEQWWAGAPHSRTQMNNFRSLRLMGLKRQR